MSDTAEANQVNAILFDEQGTVADLVEEIGKDRLPFSIRILRNRRELDRLVQSDLIPLILINAVDNSEKALSVFDYVRATQPESVQVIVADPLEHDLVGNAIRHGAADWLPIIREPDRFLELLQGLIKKLDWLVEPLSIEGGLREEPNFCRIIGSSTGIQSVLKNIEIAVASDVPVMIYGDTGTGKELVAKALHYRGPRRKFPFKAVNCAAIPEPLLESELFGHERGAFTGAVNQRKGKFELADRGTLFLDEIGEMSPAVQAKLLRVIEEQRLERLGGTEELNVNVRLVCATNKDLLELSRSGDFREDLFYRLAVFKIALPPLRERRADIPELAEYFRARYSAQSGKMVTEISEAAMALLCTYDWPGNVRELQNSIRRAVLVTQIPVLEPQHFDLHRVGEDEARIIEGLEDGLMRVMVALKRGEVLPLEELEEIFIRMALDVTGGNVSEAAEKLGISRSTIYRKIQEHGIPFQKRERES